MTWNGLQNSCQRKSTRSAPPIGGMLETPDQKPKDLNHLEG